MPYTYSPLRYPGGKTKLSKSLKKIIDCNNLKGCTYIEPFAGGAGVALALLFDNYVSNIVINDLDKSIYSLWYSILNYTKEFCAKIQTVDICMDEWYLQKEVQQNKSKSTLFDLGFSTFFLNRTNRSGIIKAGVIGGKNQQGNYKMDCRFNKASLIDKIKLIATYKEKITLYNLDTEEIIKTILPQYDSNTFIYFDPPYYIKGPKLYENYYKNEDHQKLAHLIKQDKAHSWVITYDNTKEIISTYREYRKLTYNINYSASTKKSGSEVMIFSDKLTIPPL